VKLETPDDDAEVTYDDEELRERILGEGDEKTEEDEQAMSIKPNKSLKESKNFKERVTIQLNLFLYILECSFTNCSK